LQLIETLRVHPYELSFFNVAAGGQTRRGMAVTRTWIGARNAPGLDLTRRGAAPETTVAYFGGADPGYYARGARLFAADRGEVPPGLYAVSSFLLCCGPEVMSFHRDRAAAAGFERLRRAVRTRGEPVGRVGYSILLFRIRP
jgi:hypothetical protein